MDRGMVWHAEDAVISIKILVKRELEDGRAAMAGNDNRPSKEESPDTEPALAVLSDYLFTVGEPVVIPVEDCGGIMDAKDVHILHLEARGLEVLHNPA